MRFACRLPLVSKMLQVRNVPDDLHAELRRRAADAGMSLSDYVLRELERVADRSPMAEVFARSAAHRVRMPADEVVEAIRAERDSR